MPILLTFTRCIAEQFIGELEALRPFFVFLAGGLAAITTIIATSFGVVRAISVAVAVPNPFGKQHITIGAIFNRVGVPTIKWPCTFTPRAAPAG